MLDAVAHASAVRLIADESRSTLLNSPIRAGRRRNEARRRASVILRRLADGLEPAPVNAEPVPAEYRDGHYRRGAATI